MELHPSAIIVVMHTILTSLARVQVELRKIQRAKPELGPLVPPPPPPAVEHDDEELL